MPKTRPISQLSPSLHSEKRRPVFSAAHPPWAPTCKLLRWRARKPWVARQRLWAAWLKILEWAEANPQGYKYPQFSDVTLAANRVLMPPRPISERARQGCLVRCKIGLNAGRCCGMRRAGGHRRARRTGRTAAEEFEKWWGYLPQQRGRGGSKSESDGNEALGLKRVTAFSLLRTAQVTWGQTETSPDWCGAGKV